MKSATPLLCTLLLAACGSVPYKPPANVPTAKLVGQLRNAGLFVLSNAQCRQAIVGKPYRAWDTAVVAVSTRGEVKAFEAQVPALEPVRLLVSIYGSGSDYCPLGLVAMLQPGGSYELSAERTYSDGLLAVFVGCTVRIVDRSTGLPAATLPAPNGQLPEPC